MEKRSLQSEQNRKNVPEECSRQYIKKLKEMIDCKTVFKRTGENQEEFQKFYKRIEENFPLVSERAERMTFGSGCFIYCIRGEKAQKNVMLMSHHDVVEAEGDWKTNPFSAVEKEGALYGRGTIDTKTPLFAELQACEELLQEGWSLEGINLYIGSSNNEEVCGDGMVLAVNYLKQQGIRFEVVVDEGGAITSGMLPGYAGKSAMIAVHEKSRHMYLCKVSLSEKGHGGLNPSDDSAILRLSRFMDEVSKKKIYKEHFYPEVQATFERHAPYMKFPMNIIFGNLRLFSPFVRKIMAKIPQARTMLSTSIAFTTCAAGSREDPQIRAKEAECTMFLRCVREEDLERGLEKIKEIAKKYGVEISLLERDYCKPSAFDSHPYHVMEAVLEQNFPDVVAAPFLLTAGTDARRFSDIADHILRFAPVDLNSEQFASIHGDNEYISIRNIGQCVCFYKDFLKAI